MNNLDNGVIGYGQIKYTALPYPLPNPYKQQLIDIGLDIESARKAKRGFAKERQKLEEIEILMRDKIGIPHVKAYP